MVSYILKDKRIPMQNNGPSKFWERRRLVLTKRRSILSLYSPVKNPERLASKASKKIAFKNALDIYSFKVLK